MKISIITVSYNSEKYIASAIESVVSQTYSDIEYIIIDGGSTDNTVNIIKKFEPEFNGRMRWISQKDNGLYDAMNKGIRLATGDVIGLINSDDLFCDNLAIEKFMTIFNNNQQLDSIYADLYYVAQNDTDKIVRRWVTGMQRPFKIGWHPAHPTFYIKKVVYEKFGFFNLDFKLAADFEIMLRFLDKHTISTLYLPEPLVKMRLGGETNKSLKNIYRQNIECIKAFTVNQLQVNQFLYPFYRTIPKLLQFKK